MGMKGPFSMAYGMIDVEFSSLQKDLFVSA
jgi:hypothetical protein